VIQIWDAWVRLFHWSLALAVTFLLISGETGVGFYDWHRLTGEVVLGLLLFRIIWGVIGSSNARLLSLIKHPRHAIFHLKELALKRNKPERGHNAAGGWAVLAMLVILGVQAGTGMFIADEDEFIEGALYGSLSSNISDLLYQVHHTNARLIQILVLVHILMIAVYLLRSKQNLITPMITGRMHWPAQVDVPEVKFIANILGVIIAVVAAVTIALVTGWFSL